MTMASLPLFDLSNVVVQRGPKEALFELLVPSLVISPGEVLAVVGPSGCGKSTLLDLLAFILAPTAVGGHFRFCPGGGKYLDMNAVHQGYGIDGLAEIRKRYVGYVPQVGGLLPFVDVWTNISVSPRLLGSSRDADISALVERLGLKRHLGKLPAALSVGERQRAAIARALAHRPLLVIADEPTAALDPPNADKVMNLFLEEARNRGSAAVIATHDWNLVEALGLRRITARLEQAHSGLVRAYFET